MQMASKAWLITQDHATLLLCAKAEGNVKNKPLMVYRTQNPQALKRKNLNHMPVHWRWNKNAWMISEIFWEWFHNGFNPKIEFYFQDKNLVFKILLILDNKTWNLEMLTQNMEVLFMHQTHHHQIQPLSQDIIKAFKAQTVREPYSKA